jgi:hypothetical protein
MVRPQDAIFFDFFSSNPSLPAFWPYSPPSATFVPSTIHSFVIVELPCWKDGHQAPQLWSEFFSLPCWSGLFSLASWSELSLTPGLLLNLTGANWRL